MANFWPSMVYAMAVLCLIATNVDASSDSKPYIYASPPPPLYVYKSLVLNKYEKWYRRGDWSFTYILELKWGTSLILRGLLNDSMHNFQLSYKLIIVYFHLWDFFYLHVLQRRRIWWIGQFFILYLLNYF